MNHWYRDGEYVTKSGARSPDFEARAQQDKQHVLAACWCASLEVVEVGPHDHFELLGGDSLHALWIVGEAEKAGLRLPEDALRRYPLLGDLAAHATIVDPTAWRRAVARAFGDPLPEPDVAHAAPSGALAGEARWAVVEDVLRGFIDAGEIAGATLAVASADEVLHRVALGHAELVPSRPMCIDTPFCVASMSKPFVATAAMLLVEAGLLWLDDDVGRHVPELRDLRLPDGVAPRRRPTVRDLLRHTSGILDHRLELRTETLSSFVQRCAGEPLHFEPGTRWGYSSAGIMVAASIVERIAGTSLERFLRESLWEPLGMRATSFLLDEERGRTLARTYGKRTAGVSADPVSLPDDILEGGCDVGTISPTRGLVSTADDLATFCRMILRGGELDGRRYLSRAAVELMTQISTGDLAAGFVPGMGWGLGWAVVRDERAFDPCLGSGTFGHAGSRGTQMWVRPREGLVTILLMQRAGIENVEGSPLHLDVERAILRCAPMAAPHAAGGGR